MGLCQVKDERSRKALQERGYHWKWERPSCDVPISELSYVQFQPNQYMSDLQDVWPPIPEDNYRKSHLITAEWVDKVSLSP
jgi:hypothetical protein